MKFEANHALFANGTHMCTSGSLVHSSSSREFMSSGTCWERSFDLKGIGQNLLFQVSTLRWCNKFTMSALHSYYVLKGNMNIYFYSLESISTFAYAPYSSLWIRIWLYAMIIENKNVTSLTDREDESHDFPRSLFLSQILPLLGCFFMCLLTQHFHYLIP